MLSNPLGIGLVFGALAGAAAGGGGRAMAADDTATEEEEAEEEGGSLVSRLFLGMILPLS